jgi:hypothetical protein
MTEDDLKEFLEENKESIKSAVRAKMIESLLANHHWEISAEISKVVEAFVADEIVPEVKKYLADNKGPIVQAALVGAAAISDTLAKAIVERTAARLAPDSYQFRAVLKALFD